jgi:hypothetical protein
MKKVISALLLAGGLGFVSGAEASEITSRITDSVQLSVEGAALQSSRIGSSYSVNGSNIGVTTLGGLGAGSATAAPSINAGSYTIGTDEQAFSFSESSIVGDTPVTTQGTISNNGRFDSPNLYGVSITNVGGSAGTLAGSLSATSVPSVTAGGPGTTATAQRTIELSVFK